MISILRATEKEVNSIVNIGKISVEEAHRDSSPKEALNQYLEKNYSVAAIQEELSNTQNIYHIIQYNENAVGFSKIILNEDHPNIHQKNTAKLDRIYLLKEFFNLKLGLALLNYNIEFCKEQHQSGIWLFTWIGNKRAVNFYLKAGFTIIGSHRFNVTETHSNENHHMLLNF